ncbi:MAG: succinylglutamate desuccinylase/aspartoacylase family protein [Balneolaceae bacterium]
MMPSKATVTADIQDRVLSHSKSDREGPLFIALCGMHGNETYGLAALRKTDELLTAAGGIQRGEWIGLVANVGAVSAGVRYIDEDMNRIWFPSILDKIRRCPAEELHSHERRELKELLGLLDRCAASGRELILVDLHSFSAPGGLFVITPRSAPHRKTLETLTVPLIFGIDDALQGTALRYFHDQGHCSMAFEGGSHHEPGTMLNMVSYLMLMLERFGMIEEDALSDFGSFREQICRSANHLPNRVELAYQHLIEPGDEFVMRPGFQNFDRIQKGDWLADDRTGAILAPCGGFILMPLYQSQGSDGFFIVQEC